MTPRVRKFVGWWLVVGCVMIFMQVIIGGVTRLTESGLSITEWKPVKGTVPPLNETEWQNEFDLYKNTVQFKTINQDITLSEFKWIYFWEYLHRFWARFMGIAFLAGFIPFVLLKWIDKKLILKSLVIPLWAGIIGAYGWFMVWSGLKSGPYVPPINLSMHLILAMGLLGYMVLLTTYVFRGVGQYTTAPMPGLKKLSVAILVVLLLQIFFGGIVSGMKAGLDFPTWPDMNGQLIPSTLTNEPASFKGLLFYDGQAYWLKAFIQFTHRFTAYTLVGLVVIFYVKALDITKDSVFKSAINLFPVIILLQATIGILTVINCTGKIPVGYGVLHQAGAMLLLAETVFIIFHLYSKPEQQA
jgi:cytochrome c oxidase assembly protein subunit 15